MKTSWDLLFKNVTFRDRSPIQSFDGRDPFENDYSRLISSSPIRRLQDKTQVFPLEKSDFIRTRLTHSLEVSSIGRSLGKSVELQLLKKGLIGSELSGYMSSLLATAGLVHDLGNPPFGHFGEAAIQEFFRKYFQNSDKRRGWSEQEMKDFEFFDGNVQTFRILRKLHYFKDEHSYNLSFPSLASIVKYPRTSTEGNISENRTNIADKKFGYFVTEQLDYEQIDQELGLGGNRHPIVFLLEAADDIAYSAADIEDGVKLGLLNFETIREVFNTTLDTSVNEEKELLSELDELYVKCMSVPENRLDLTVQQFRISTQREMIKGVITEFILKYEDIMAGQYKHEMLEECSAKRIRKAFRTLSKIVFKHKSITQVELAGWRVIQGLLDEFIQAAHSDNFHGKGNTKESRLYNIISSNYRHVYETYARKRDNELYNRFQLVVDFISGMTDTYALALYQKITGISL